MSDDQARDLGTVWKRLDPKVRNLIRKAARSSLCPWCGADQTDASAKAEHLIDCGERYQYGRVRR